MLALLLVGGSLSIDLLDSFEKIVGDISSGEQIPVRSFGPASEKEFSAVFPKLRATRHLPDQCGKLQTRIRRGTALGRLKFEIGVHGNGGRMAALIHFPGQVRPSRKGLIECMH